MSVVHLCITVDGRRGVVTGDGGQAILLELRQVDSDLDDVRRAFSALNLPKT